MNRRQTSYWKAIYYLLAQGCQPWCFPAAGKDLRQISSKSRSFQRPSFTRSVYSPRAWHINRITELPPQTPRNCTAGTCVVSLVLAESTGFTKRVHRDCSTCIRYFYSEHVSGPSKNIHRLQTLAQQVNGTLIIPGLPLQESRLIRPSMFKYLHFEKDKIIFSTLWTVLSCVCRGLFKAELAWITNEKMRFLCGAGLHSRAFYRHNPGLNHTTPEMCSYSE